MTLREARENAGYGLRAFSRTTKISPTYLNQIETSVDVKLPVDRRRQFQELLPDFNPTFTFSEIGDLLLDGKIVCWKGFCFKLFRDDINWIVEYNPATDEVLLPRFTAAMLASDQWQIYRPTQ